MSAAGFTVIGHSQTAAAWTTHRSLIVFAMGMQTAITASNVSIPIEELISPGSSG